MIPELAVLSLLLERQNYQKYRQSINLANVKQNMKDLYGVYLTLDKMYATIDAEQFTIDEFEAYYWLQYPLARKEEHEIISDTIFASLRGQSETISESILQIIHERAIASKIALLAFDISIGKGKISDLSSMFTLASKIKEIPTDIEFVTDDLNVLIDRAVGSGGFRWRLESLNLRLGPLRRGDLGVVFSRPEVGKTTFLASEISHMATQTEAPIIWFNNEERGEKVKLRIYQATLGRDLTWILANRESAHKEFLELTNGRIKLIDDGVIHYDFVERVVNNLQPSLIIFDKLDHVKGFDAERKDLQLGAIYRWARELAKEYSPFIGICHADGAAEGIKWLTMEHMDNAKTSKQETADWILGIGQTHDVGMDYVRYFHLCKNKLIGDPGTNPSLRHDRWEVIIQPDIARYCDERK